MLNLLKLKKDDKEGKRAAPGEIEVVSSRTMEIRMKPIVKRLLDDLEGHSASVSSERAGSRSADMKDPKEFALLALASHMLMRTKFSTEFMYTGALLAEWYYLNAALAGSHMSKKSWGTSKGGGGNRTSVGSGRWEPVKPKDNAMIEKVHQLLMASSRVSSASNVVLDSDGFPLPTVHTNPPVDEIIFNAVLAKTHLEIFARTGLMSEPYHVRRARALLKDCYEDKEERKKLLFFYDSVPGAGKLRIVGSFIFIEGAIALYWWYLVSCGVVH